MAKVGFDPSKLNKLRDDWMTRYNQASNLLAQFNNNQVADRFNSTDTDDPMSKNGSVFRAEGTNGAGAAQNSSSIVNSNQNTTYDATTQQMPTGQNTIVTGSGTTTLSSSVKDSQSGDNQGGNSDLTQKKNDAKQKLEESRQKYLNYLEVALNYVPTASSTDSVFTAEDSGSGDKSVNLDANKPANSGETGQAEQTSGAEQSPTASVDGEDASDPTKTDTAYQNPDTEKETVEKETMKQAYQQQLKQDQQNQEKLEEEAKKVLELDNEAA